MSGTTVNNLEKSEVVIAKILALLMEWGIQECTLNFEELDLDPDEFGSFFFPCVQWLVDEGVIRIRSSERYLSPICGGIISAPAITSRGLNLLGQKLNLGEGPTSETLSDRVQTVSNQGPNYSGIGDFFGGILGGFTKSMGS
jgi:hypothetical protein